ncbi:MAG: DUF3341 domain-containing protein [Polyangiaceae bacterium]|nr:DUF3341 domain-containing protein [Polyangiaceae bacterium]NUQ72121.1 DUF3341 domain-containing protein [Polyangiaceae bacterium]
METPINVSAPSISKGHGAMVPSSARTHVLLFDDPGRTLHAVKKLRAAGFDVEEVYSPFPVHGIDEALGLAETRLPYATLAGGALGLALAVAFQVWVHTKSWPLNIGGKSNLALPGLIPVIFEVTVLLAAIATVGTLLARNRLIRPGEVAPDRAPHPRVTDDRFAVLVPETSGSFSMARFNALCEELRPVERKDSWRIQ